MGKIITYETKVWDVTADMGNPKQKDRAFEERSPADPVTVLQAYAEYVGITGGDGTSRLNITVDQVVELFASTYTKPLKIHEVGDSGGTPIETFELLNGAGPAAGIKNIRIGNFDYNDARKMRLFAETFQFTVDNPGTAYTAGYVNIIPVGYIVTV